MESEPKLLNLVERIYRAASQPSFWEEFLEVLSDIHHGITSLIIHDERSHVGAITASSELDATFARQYQAYYGQIDPWAVPAALVSGRTFSSAMVIPDAALERSEFYADFLRRFGVFHQSASIIAKEDSVLAVLSLLRARHRGAYSDSDLQLLRSLLPHLQQAVRIQRQMGDLEQRAASAEGAVDLMPIGVLFVDIQLKLLWANKAATGILAQNDGVRLELGRISLKSPEGSQLRHIVRQAARTAASRGIEGGGTVQVSRPSSRQSFSLVVMPALPGQFAFVGPVAPRVMLFVFDPEKQKPLPLTILSRLFGFTGAESRVAAQLMEGLSPEEIALRGEVSKNTVRCQITQLLEKTGTRRQGELVGMLWRSPAGLRQE